MTLRNSELRETPKFQKKSLRSGLICLNHPSQKLSQHKLKTYVAKDEFYRIQKDRTPLFQW